MNCNICFGNMSSFKHSVFSDDIIFCDNKVEDVNCYRCDSCGYIMIDQEDLQYKAKLKVLSYA